MGYRVLKTSYVWGMGHLSHEEVHRAFFRSTVPHHLELPKGFMVPLHGHQDVGPLERGLGVNRSKGQGRGDGVGVGVGVVG